MTPGSADGCRVDRINGKMQVSSFVVTSRLGANHPDASICLGSEHKPSDCESTTEIYANRQTDGSSDALESSDFN